MPHCVKCSVLTFRKKVLWLILSVCVLTSPISKGKTAELKEVEELVNTQIRRNHELKTAEMGIDEAFKERRNGALW